jgi:hypothetical protein
VASINVVLDDELSIIVTDDVGSYVEPESSAELL